MNQLSGPTALYPHAVPFSKCRTIAIFKLVRRKILLDLREANAYIWGDDFLIGKGREYARNELALLRACAKKMLEELGEVAEHTGNPPAFSRFAGANRPALLEELADVAEVMKLLSHSFGVFLEPLGGNLTSGPWNDVWSGWQKFAVIKQLPPLEDLLQLMRITRMEMALIGNLLPRGGSWEAIEAERTRKQLAKGPLVPFLLYGTALHPDDPWCDVLAAKHTEVSTYTFDRGDSYTFPFDHL